MRKLIALLFLIPLAFVACGEDEKTFTEKNYLVGKWEVIETGSNGTGGIILYQDYENDVNCKDSYTFNSDLTFTNSDYTTNGACTATTITGTYDRVSTNLNLNYTIQVDGNPEPATISLTVVSLTFTEAVVAYQNDLNQLVYLKLQKV